MKRVLAIILGGGAGTRLYPLTKMRAKPAVPLAGKYRLIDIPVSNCINSEINKILHTPVTNLRAPQPRQQRHSAMRVLEELFELQDQPGEG